MTPEELIAAGQTLHGSRWRTALARDLELSNDQIARYERGQWPIPRTVELAVRQLLAEKGSP